MIDLFSNFDLIELREILPHEDFSFDALLKLATFLSNHHSYQLPPLIIDKKSKVIIDGHHRYQALKKIGKRFAPCTLLDYSDNRIIAFQENLRGNELNKSDIIKRATQKKLYPQKFTCHGVRLESGELIHISKVNKKISIPLERL